MAKPFYTSAATTDLVSILKYISQDKPNAALDWIETIEEKCLLIANNPEIGERRPELGELVRSSLVGRYVIFYQQSKDRVVILRVMAGDQQITLL